MPAKKKYGKKRKFSKRRVFRKKKVYRKSRIPKALFPKSRMVRMVYVENSPINPAAGTMATHTMRANSIYDPSYTLTGHQPLGYDQCALAYTRYRVLGAKITVRFVAQGSAAADDCYVGIQLHTDTSFISDIEGCMEQPMQTNTWLGNMNSSRSTVTLTKTFSAKRFWGVKSGWAKDTTTEASFGYNPADVVYFSAWVCPHAAAIDPAAIYLNVKVEYAVCVFDPIQMLMS